MYLVNFPQNQGLEARFISVDRYRTGQGLLGAKDRVNRTYTVPGGEKFAHNLPYLTISVYVNGVRQSLLDDYMVVESGGPGTGYDTVVLEYPLRPNEKLLADYVVVLPATP